MAGARRLEIAAVAVVADEALVAFLELRREALDDVLAHRRVALGLLGVEADDVAPWLCPGIPAADDDLLDLDVGELAAGAIDGKRHHRLLVGKNDVAHLRIRALAGAEDVFDAAYLELGDGLGADHAAVGDDAHAGNAEAPAQPVDHREQRLHVGGVARPSLRADRPALLVEHHAHHDLLQIRAMVLGFAVLAQRLAAGSVEVERGRVGYNQVMLKMFIE